jgi:hypothetical protein
VFTNLPSRETVPVSGFKMDVYNKVAVTDLFGPDLIRIGIRIWITPVFSVQKSHKCGKNQYYFNVISMVLSKFNF